MTSAETLVRSPVAPDAARIAATLRAALGQELAAVIFFGSRFLGTTPNASSACDLFVVVEDYGRFYRKRVPGLVESRHPALLTALNRVLSPNILSYSSLRAGDAGAGAKCFVISARDFARALSRRSPDHFVKGRLTQDVVVIDAQSDERRRWAEALFDEARRSAIDWVPSFFATDERTEEFGVEEFCMTMLRVSYAHEIRPEPEARVREVYDAQRSFFGRVYGAILADSATQGLLERVGDKRVGDRYRIHRQPSALTRLGWAAHFRRSKLRSTLRWFKYTFTFEDWIDYLIRKVERRTGMLVEVTPLERRLPFLLLWPKVFRVLRYRRRAAAPTSRPAEPGGRP